MNIIENYSLSRLNTFGLDIKARAFCEVAAESEMIGIAGTQKWKGKPKFILGGGSNILFTHDLNALCIHNLIKGINKIREDEEYVWVKSGGGEAWHQLVIYCVENNYGGVENLSLIPGSVGAAPIQNIGAYGVELKETFSELEAIHLETGEKKIFSAADCRFGYRDSIFKREFKNQYAITSITLRLHKNPGFNTSYGAIEQELKAMDVQTPTVASISQAVINIRRSKLPDPAVIGNCGSFFKNPEVPEDKYSELKKIYPDLVGYKTTQGKIKLAAGWLIESCGWKGKKSGNVGMHTQQALVLVNYGGASGKELFDHALQVQQSVLGKFDVFLEMEVNIL
ncbi:MAG: UDP-N-acetylmuramate dehydrogenase [Bacteroidetes bacterium]|nr:UDP-N-acetylmuramate dehydrogenase [Bacteroidota bacterium]